MSDYVGENFKKEGISITQLYNKIFGYVGLPFPLPGVINPNRIGGDFSKEEGVSSSNPAGLNALAEQYKKSLLDVEMIMPMRITIPDGDVWEMQTEPMVSVSGSNRLIRRYVKHAKQGGTIKERWNSDDYSITIKGVIVNYQAEAYPYEEVGLLRKVCESKKSLQVLNPLLTAFGISRMQIDDFDIPYTEGLTMQQYSIKAYSDNLFKALLVEA